MKTTILSAAVLCTCLNASAADDDYDVSVYGRITYNAISDDTSDELYYGRHEFAESNLGLKGSLKEGNLTFGAQLEIGLNEGVSSLLQNGSNSRNRIQELWVQGDFGKVRLGTGESITYIISDADQSGTWFSDPLGMSARFGSTRRGPAGQSQTPFAQVQTIFNERIRYDSPTFIEGATFHAQLNEDGGNEIAIKYLANGFRFNAWTVDHGDADNDADPQANVDGFTTPGFFGAKDGQGILAGYKHSSGINFSATSGSADQVDGGEREFTSWKLGYTKNKHAVSYSSGSYESSDLNGLSGSDHDRATVAYNYSLNSRVKFWVQFTDGDTDFEESFSAIALGGMYKFQW